jgi:hypothetical protein
LSCREKYRVAYSRSARDTRIAGQILVQAHTWAGPATWLRASTTAALSRLSSVSIATVSAVATPIWIICGRMEVSRAIPRPLAELPASSNDGGYSRPMQLWRRFSKRVQPAAIAVEHD